MAIILILVILIAIASVILSYGAGYKVGIGIGYSIHKEIESGELEEDFFDWVAEREGVKLEDTGGNHE